MKTGEKIRRIRKFRGITQREFEKCMGLGKNRLAQYEMGYRVPKKEMLEQMAKKLDVSPLSLQEMNGETPEEIMEIFFWLEESAPEVIRLFRMEQMTEKEESRGYQVLYREQASWRICRPIGMWFDHPEIHEALKEWFFHKEELEHGEISLKEYFEWKIGWPMTIDHCGTVLPKKKWRTEIQPEQEN